jgi:hypothetical protein
MFFNPTGLAIFYPFHDDELTFRAAIPAILVLSGISIVAVLLIRKKPQILIGWCWFLGTLIPAIGLVQVGSQSHADRYLYIPMLGLAFVYPVLFEALRSIRASVRTAVTGVSLIVLGVAMILATRIQVTYWKDGVALFGHSLAVTGNCSTNVINLAVAYHRAGRYQELISFADSKIPVAPPEYKGRLAAIKASAFYYMQKYELAIATANQALEWGGIEVTPCWTLAISNFELGKLDEAARWLAKARAIQKPVNRVNLVDMEHDASLASFERMLKEKAGPKASPGSKTLLGPATSGGRS